MDDREETVQPAGKHTPEPGVISGASIIRGSARRVLFGGTIMVLVGITQAIVARRYGPSGYGTFTLGYVIVVFFGSCLDIGIGGILPARVRLASADRTAAYLRGALVTVLSAGLVVLLVIVPLLMVVWRQYGYTPVMVGLLSIAGIATSTAYVIAIYRESHLRVARAMLPLVVTSLIQLVWSVIAPRAMSAQWFVVSLSLGGAGISLLAALATRTTNWTTERIRPLEWIRTGRVAAREMIPTAWPLLIVGIAAFVQVWLDKPLLGVLLSREQLGVYTALVLILRVLRFLPQSLTTLLTSVYGRVSSDQAEFGRVARLDLLTFSVYFGVVSVVVAAELPRVMTLAFGGEFALIDGRVVTVLVALYLLVCPWLTQSTNWLNAMGMTRTNMRLSLANAALQTLGIVILVPSWGLTGAAWAIVLGNVVDAAIRVAICRRLVMDLTSSYYLVAGLAGAGIGLSPFFGDLCLAVVPVILAVGVRSWWPAVTPQVEVGQ